MIRTLHVLDHSIPLHSGYTFRTAALLREQRALGWETFHLTSPKQGISPATEETVDGLHFYRTPLPSEALSRKPLLAELALMRQLEKRLTEVATALKPDILHAHSPVLNVLPALRVGKHLGIPVVYEIRAFWEDAAVDHGKLLDFTQPWHIGLFGQFAHRLGPLAKSPGRPRHFKNHVSHLTPLGINGLIMAHDT